MVSSPKCDAMDKTTAISPLSSKSYPRVPHIAEAIVSRPLSCLMGFWTLLVLPLMFLKAAHFEEGTVVGLARGAVEDGHWLTPYLYGVRFVERPDLLSVLIALINWPFGHVDPTLAQLPTALALLGGGVLVFTFASQYASRRAALFASVCFFVSPMILQKLVTAEPDLLLSVLMFAAFVTWWNTHSLGRVGIARWVGIGAMLGLASLCKGPQPCAFFFIGIGAYLLWHWRWRDIGGLFLSGLVSGAIALLWYGAIHEPGDVRFWLVHGRLGAPITIAEMWSSGVGFSGSMLVGSLPAVLLLLPLALSARVRGLLGERRSLVLALFFYAAGCTAILTFWPGARGRYAMPAILALAAIAGLVFEGARQIWPRYTRGVVVIAGALASFQICFGMIALPLYPALGGAMRGAGQAVATAIVSQPGPLFVSLPAMNRNMLLYVPAPIRAVDPSEFAALAGPVWILGTRAEIEALGAGKASEAKDIPGVQLVLARLK